RQAPRGAVDQKQLDVLAAHVAIISRDRADVPSPRAAPRPLLVRGAYLAIGGVPPSIAQNLSLLLTIASTF
ncbi:MAG: hypothetical protein WBP81_25785, partial [Solirubrobacteraceae bacterium]